MIVLLVMTDGRDDLLAETLQSAKANLFGRITWTVIHDDTGDPAHRAEIAARYPQAEVVGGSKAGFGGAIDRAWTHLQRGHLGERFVFHLEDDFTFNRAVNLWQLARVLDAHPHLAQIALRRQPWNDQERDAGGIIECWPDEYLDHSQSFRCGDRTTDVAWLEHRLFFTTNPSLYRLEATQRGWPTGQGSEAEFSRKLFEDPSITCGFWGARDSGEAVTHIGTDRVGVGY